MPTKRRTYSSRVYSRSDAKRFATKEIRDALDDPVSFGHLASEGVTPIVPTLEQIAKLSDLKQDEEPLRSIIGAKDIFDVAKVKDGYVVVKERGVVITDSVTEYQTAYDVVAGHRKSDVAIAGFYGIPVLKSQSDLDEEIFSIIFDDFCESDKRRHFIWTPEDLYLVDTYISGGIVHQFSPYYATSFEVLRENEGKEGERLIEKMMRIGAELSRTS